MGLTGRTGTALTEANTVRLRRRACGQGGVTLIEALVVLVLASVAILAFAVGLQTVVATDGATNRQQRSSAGMSSVAEVLRSFDRPDPTTKGGGVPWKVCCPTDPACQLDGAADLAAYYRDKALAALSDNSEGSNKTLDFRITSIEYRTGGTYTGATTVPADFSSTCPVTPSGTTDAAAVTALRLTVKVNVGSTTETGVVVKRRPLPGEAS